MAGQFRAFTAEETEVLRRVARRLKADRQWSAAKLGEEIGIAQQNVSRFIAANATGGINRQTANELAKVAGYRDVEHLLLEAGVLAEMDQPPAQWTTRDAAVSVARKLGYPEAAIMAIVHRYTGTEYAGRAVRWWIDKVVLESLSRADDDPVIVPPRTSEGPRPVPRRRDGTEG